MRQADQPKDGSWRPNSSPHWAEAERRGEEGSGGGEKRGRARTEEAELAGVDLDEHVLAAHRGGRRPGRASDRRRGRGEIAAAPGRSARGGGGWRLRPAGCGRAGGRLSVVLASEKKGGHGLTGTPLRLHSESPRRASRLAVSGFRRRETQCGALLGFWRSRAIGARFCRGRAQGCDDRISDRRILVGS